ncbi:MAG: RNA polymerase sigma-70 factor ECF [Planctomycetota bacterium]|nr:MAG: RNA polymerase sigma-70 factor ECF [Planctomycetota bacterium]
MTSLSDDPFAPLMRRVAGGDEAAFAEVIAGTRTLVAGIIHRFLGHARETEDLAQEVYLRAWLARQRWQPTARVTTWLATIASRLCLNERPKLARRRTLPEQDVAAEVDDRLGEDEAQRVRQAVLSLPDDQRMAVALKYFGERTDREVAEALELSLSAAQALLFRARKKLIDLLPPP